MMRSGSGGGAVGEASSSSSQQVKQLILLTWNCGLLDYKLFGCVSVYSNPPHADLRLPYMPAAILRSNADVVVLQEVYAEAHFLYLKEELAATYPFYGRQESGGALAFHNGLVTFSKYPVEKCYLDKYQKVSRLEYYLASKSSLVCTVNIHGERYTIINLHTTAGGESCNPEDADADMDRESELAQALKCAQQALDANEHVILIGDFNCGLEASRGNYEFVLSNNYKDAYLSAVSKTPEKRFTWDPTNLLNAVGPHSTTCAQRIDHVMLPKSSEWEGTSSAIIFDEQVVHIKGEMHTISDHYGLCVTLSR